jgi:hypothetical protein
MAELFQTSPQNITTHLSAIFSEGEIEEAATCKEYLQVRREGRREVRRTLKHYALPAILAVGYRVRSARGTQFRQWASARLGELVVKGFTLDDRRLKNPPGTGQVDYFDELLSRIRDIRSSERLFYRKVLDIYATSVDYDGHAEASQQFFKTVQNKMHWAAHGHTAAEIIVDRADAARPNMGLTTWVGDVPRKSDVTVAKNYLVAGELDVLNRIVTAYLEFAELQALGRRPMHMRDWIAKLDEYLRVADRDVLTHAGSVSHEAAVQTAEAEYATFAHARASLPQPVDAAFEEAIAASKAIEKSRPSKRGRTR